MNTEQVAQYWQSVGELVLEMAEQVDVHIRGTQFRFDGWGLVTATRLGVYKTFSFQGREARAAVGAFMAQLLGSLTEAERDSAFEALGVTAITSPVANCQYCQDEIGEHVKQCEPCAAIEEQARKKRVMRALGNGRDWASAKGLVGAEARRYAAVAVECARAVVKGQRERSCRVWAEAVEMTATSAIGDGSRYF